MKKIVLFFILILVFIIGCQPDYHSQPKEHYKQFKNLNLDYEWDFNASLVNEKGKLIGGHTFNQHYFQLKKYNFFEELTSSIPYPIQYKHEEGHVYQLKLLNLSDDLEEFYEHKCKFLNVTEIEVVRQYFISVTEGFADYYSINYFKNSLSKNYFEYVESQKHDSTTGFKQHYQGLKFVNYTMSNRLYSDIQDFIINICTEKQHTLYGEFLKTLN